MAEQYKYAYNGNGNGLESEETRGSAFNPIMLLFKYLKYWYWIVLSVGLALALAFLYLRYTVPMYRVTSTIMIKGDTDSEGMAQRKILAELGYIDNNVNVSNELMILKSKELMTEVVKKTRP